MWREKMIILSILLVLRLGRCMDDHIFETKTVGIGQDVNLTCARNRIWHSTNLFWIRLVSGTFPETLGASIAYDYTAVVTTDRVTVKQEPGTFVLHITKTQLSDTAVYYCINVRQRTMTFSKGIFLRIKGPEPDITAVTEHFPPDLVHPGDSVTLQCSVLSDSENKTCPGEHSVFWFRAGSDESHPSLIYTQRNNSEGCEKSPKTQSARKCVYSLSQTVSSSDAGTYYCAVATCGEILFASGTKLDIEVGSTCDSKNNNTLVFLLCAALATSLIVTAFLVYSIRKNYWDCCHAAATLQTNAATASGTEQVWQLGQQGNEDSLVYYTPKFTMKTANKAGRRNQRKEETIYTDVRAFVID